jgi:hypothetical protein
LKKRASRYLAGRDPQIKANLGYIARLSQRNQNNNYNKKKIEGIKRIK